ncbi:palmitoyltransferase ZDHHC12 isoform X3 [Callorhinus ursinus]|uniref:palmitoyltransferase ZDHHC12 isoform X3 n=1 Tax=Callorhinus ursinus TaxID=34884 RepID=UPI003CD029E9
MAPWALLSPGVLVRTGHTVLTWGITLVLFLHDTAPASLSFSGLSSAAAVGRAGGAAPAPYLPAPRAGLPAALPGRVAHGPGLCECPAPAPGGGQGGADSHGSSSHPPSALQILPGAGRPPRLRPQPPDLITPLRGAGLEPSPLHAHSSPCGPGTAASVGAACAATTTTAPGWRTAWGSATTRSSWPTWRCSWWCFCGACTWHGLASISPSLGGYGCGPAGCSLPPSCCSPSSLWRPACSSPHTSTWWPATPPPGSSSPRTALPTSASAPATPLTAA